VYKTKKLSKRLLKHDTYVFKTQFDSPGDIHIQGEPIKLQQCTVIIMQIQSRLDCPRSKRLIMNVTESILASVLLK